MRGPRLKRFVLVSLRLLVLLTLAQTSLDATQKKPMELSYDVIRVDVVVTDRKERAVSDLTRVDFEVLENGVPQEIQFFEHTRAPLNLVLLIDASGSMKRRLAMVQEAAGRFVESLSSQDLVQVVQFNHEVSVLTDFSSDPIELKEAIEQVEASGGTALHNAIYTAIHQLRKLDRQLATGSSQQTRRLGVVLLSDGNDTVSILEPDLLLNLAREEEVTVYSIGIGLNKRTYTERQEAEPAKALLSALGYETGGRLLLIDSSQKLDEAYGQISRELRSRYLVGYFSQNPVMDGKWRQIVVRLPEKKRLKLRHRQGYYAIQDSTSMTASSR